MNKLNNPIFKWPTGLTACILITAALICAMPPCLGIAYAKRIVALDPGHGGSDGGARGPGGTREKDVCLALAKQLAAQLPAYEIVMTRSDDYSVENRGRTALANHSRADILISLHTGAGFLHGVAGSTVYYHQPVDHAGRPPSDPPDKGRMRWDDIQTAHTSASSNLAAQIKQTLQGPLGGTPVKVRHAPLVVLEGADMPAVLIEIGYLTNPATEKALTSPDQLKAYARAIAAGVEAFFAAER